MITAAQFEAVYAKRQVIARYLSHLGARPDEVDDMVQEVFAQAWAKRQQFLGINGATPETWIYAIARNEFYQQRRSLAAKLETQASKTDPVPSVTEDHTRKLLAERLMGLPVVHAKDRLIIRLRADGWQAKEVADVFDCNLNYLKTRYCRALATMRSFAEEAPRV